MTDTYTIVKFPSNDFPADYRNFVLANWLRTFLYNNPLVKREVGKQQFQEYQEHIESLLKKPNSVIRFAVLPETADGPETLLGFSVTRDLILDYVYVVKPQRLQGIGHALVPKGAEMLTHLSSSALKILQHKPDKYRLVATPQSFIPNIRCFLFNPKI